MKHLLLIAALLMNTAAASAQILDVASVNKVALPENCAVAGISPLGDYLLVTDIRNNGLSKHDLVTGKNTVLTTAPGAGYAAKISPDGQTVIYRETSYTNDGLRKNTLKSQDLATGKTTTMVKATRDLQGVEVDNNAAIAVNNGKATVKQIGKTKAKAKANAPVLFIKNRQLIMTAGGKTKVLSPNGTDESYIWPSLSPDGTRVLYYVCGNGAYVCNTDGSHVKYLGHYTAPKWYSDEVVVAMNDKDNGEYVTSSAIVAVDLDGNTQTLTDSSVVAMYPHASLQGDKIAFSTPSGEAYIININVKK